jgi:hypothetical protein
VRTHTLERLAAWEHGLCRRFNRVSDFAFPWIVFIVASHLGNGAFWYALMTALLVWGDGKPLRAVVHMVAVGVACTLLYKALKRGTARLRPYVAQPGITLCDVPLDRYSYGHGGKRHHHCRASEILRTLREGVIFERHAIGHRLDRGVDELGYEDEQRLRASKCATLQSVSS